LKLAIGEDEDVAVVDVVDLDPLLSLSRRIMNSQTVVVEDGA